MIAPIPIDNEKKACPIALTTIWGVITEKLGLNKNAIVLLKSPIKDEYIETKELQFKPMRLTDLDNKVDPSAVIENLGMIGNYVWVIVLKRVIRSLVI